MVLDLDFFTRIMLSGGTMVGVPDVAYSYRRHPLNATSAYTESLLRFEEESQLHDRVATTAKLRGWSQVARVASAKHVIKAHLLFRIVEDIARGRIGSAGRKSSFLLGLFRRSGNKTASPGII
jgi:hypothetical protein